MVKVHDIRYIRYFTIHTRSSLKTLNKHVALGLFSFFVSVYQLEMLLFLFRMSVPVCFHIFGGACLTAISSKKIYIFGLLTFTASSSIHTYKITIDL